MQKINAKKGEFVNLINGLFSVQDLKGKEFGMTVSKNIRILQTNLKEMEGVGKPSNEFLKLAEEVNKIANENASDSQERIDKLEKENKELVDIRQKQMDKLNKMMDEEMEMELYLISEEKLPEDITAKQITNIDKILIIGLAKFHARIIIKSKLIKF